MSDGDEVNITASLPQAQLDQLVALAGRRGLSANTVLQQAIATETLLSGVVDEGDKVVIQKPDNTTQQVIFTKQ